MAVSAYGNLRIIEVKIEEWHIVPSSEQVKPDANKDSGAHRLPRVPALHRHLLGFFVTGGFFSPPLVLIRAK
jgi:hypothetical protein